MAEEIERLLVRIEANAEHFDKSLRKMNSELRTSQKGTNDTLRQIESDVRRQSARMFTPMGDALRREVIRMGGIAAAGFSAKQIIDYADSYTNLQNRLKSAGLEGERLARVEAELFEAANKNGVAVDAVAKMYQRVSQSRQSLGASDEQLIALTNGVTAALRVQGVSAEEAQGPLLQLGQALGAGTVRAEELNSLLEGTPLILQAAANGSDIYKGNMQALAKAIRDGKVSSEELFSALLKGLPELEQAAAKLPLTVGQALQSLNNELGRYIGQTDSALSATARLAQGIEGLSKNLDTIIPIAVALTAVIGSRYAVAMGIAAVQTGVATVNNLAYQAALIKLQARQTGATAAQIALNGALAANPIGAVTMLIAGLVAGLVLLARHYNHAAEASRALDKQSQETSKAFSEYEDAARKAADATGEAKKAADALVESKKAAYVISMQNAQALAHETMQIAAQRAQLAKLAAEQALNQGPKTEGEAIGQLAYAGGAERAAREAQAVADRANADYIAAMQDFADLQEKIRNGFAVAPPALPGGDPAGGRTGRGARGPSPEEIAERQKILALQMEIEAAQARGDKEAERSARAQLDTLQLTKQLTDAQVANAAQVASDHITMLTDAEAAAERLEVRAREKAKREDQAKKRREQERDVLMDALEIEAELARLRGEPVAIEAAERRLFVEQRINELLAQREGLSRKEASAIANQEYDAYGDADREGAMRDEFRRSFRDGIKAALDGDVGGFFESMADRFTDRMLDNMADNLFNILSDAMKGMNGGTGGGFWSSLFGAFSGGFGGGRATGGPVTAGRLYRINENTPNSEYFMPGANGTVLTSGQVASAQGARAQPVIVQLAIDEGGLFVPRVQAISGSVAVQTTTMGVATVQDQQRATSMRRRQSLVG